MECNKSQNAQNCTCTYSGCPRKGICCECMAYHMKSGEIPGCFFSEAAEKTYNRSAEYFAADKKNRWTAN